MTKFYMTLGHGHAHRVHGVHKGAAFGNVTLDRDCIAVIEEEDIDSARKVAFDITGGEFHRVLDEEPDMSFFPRGLIPIN